MASNKKKSTENKSKNKNKSQLVSKEVINDCLATVD